MKIEKPFASLETKGLVDTSDQENLKPSQFSSQETQQDLFFNEPSKQAPKPLRIIQCFDCRQTAELRGYRFTLVPLCGCCRTKEHLRVINNQIRRRKKR